QDPLVRVGGELDAVERHRVRVGYGAGNERLPVEDQVVAGLRETGVGRDEDVVSAVGDGAAEPDGAAHADEASRTDRLGLESRVARQRGGEDGDERGRGPERHTSNLR